MPAFPAYFLLGVSILLLVPTFGRRLAARWPAEAPRPIGRRPMIAAGFALVVVPLVVVALVRPIEKPEKAIAVDTILTPTDERIDVTVEADGEARVVTWSHPPAGSSAVFFRVYRTGPGTGSSRSASTTAARRSARSRWCCSGRPASDAGATARHRPDVRYRIGVAANSRDDETAGDVATLSEPVESP